MHELVNYDRLTDGMSPDQIRQVLTDLLDAFQQVGLVLRPTTDGVSFEWQGFPPVRGFPTTNSALAEGLRMAGQQQQTDNVDFSTRHRIAVREATRRLLTDPQNAESQALLAGLIGLPAATGVSEALAAVDQRTP